MRVRPTERLSSPPALGAFLDIEEPLAVGLLGAYYFTTGSGRSQPDLSFSGNDLTPVAGAPTWSGGHESGATVLDGASAWSKSGIATVQPPFSLAAEWTQTAQTANQDILFHDAAAGGAGYGMRVGTTLSLQFLGVANYNTGFTTNPNTWYRAVLTCTANGGTATGYMQTIDSGLLQGPATATVGTVPGSPNRVTIGQDSGTHFFTGSIAWAAWWSRVLGQDEVLRLFDNPYRLAVRRERQPGYSVAAAVALLRRTLGDPRVGTRTLGGGLG